MPSLRFLTALACLCLTPAVLAAETTPVELQGLDAYIEQSMADWKVPGLAIAVVKDDKVVWVRGFGHRNLDEPQAVDADTLFAIGSNTKAFTAAALGTLVESGKLDWDDRVATLLPGFQMYDPYVTREVTLRDLLSHRSGTCGEDGVWYGTDFSTQDVISRLRYQKPAYSFRSQFCYSNSLYTAAGEVVPALTGTAWHDYVRSHLFLPLHMDTTNTSVRDLGKAADAASPHAEIGGKVQPIAWYNAASIDPAGAINSSVREMSQWMRMLLADGMYEGKQILRPETIQEMETPQMLIGGKGGEAQFLAALNPDSHFYAYGLGFFMQDYAGTKVVWHSGHIDGMSAGLGLVPSRHLGVVVLSNMDQSWLPMALVWCVIDAYAGRPQKDWSTAILKTVIADDAADKAATDDQEKAYQAGAAPHPLADYVGVYNNDLYGDVVVSLARGKLTLHVSKRFNGELKHWDYDTFQVRWDYAYLGKEYVTFDSDARGRPVSITLPGFATYLRVAR
ncbi:MAG TPA: serine hydrolase [Gammaproteobacteria bacterium]|jgi:CubicO group peptidase (beta-lactamase class C family)